MDASQVLGMMFVISAMVAIFAGSGWYMSSAMGRPPAEGLILGLLLGPLGLAIAAVIGLTSVMRQPEPPGRVDVSLRRETETGVKRYRVR